MIGSILASVSSSKTATLPSRVRPRRGLSRRGFGLSYVRHWLVLAGIAALTVMAAPTPGNAAGDARSAFLDSAFSDGVPEVQTLWLTEDRRAAMQDRLGAAMDALRVRFWRKGARTAWVLEEIGKEEPITAGIVVDNGHIAAIDVLVYRESRGGEVRLPYFREQFIDAMLTGDGTLTKGIDGISGATLSVRAMKAMARRALLLHEMVMEGDE